MTCPDVAGHNSRVAAGPSGLWADEVALVRQLVAYGDALTQWDYP